MSEKSISERGKETLNWIQKEQVTNGLGMVESTKIPDQGAFRYLLRTGEVFEPQSGMVKSTEEPKPHESVAGASEFSDHAPWIWKTPKPKSKNDKPEPYEFLSYSDWNVLPSIVAEALRSMGFSGNPYLYQGYSYRKMAGGTLRRKMIGTHSKEELLGELKLIYSSEEVAKVEKEIEAKISEFHGKYKDFPKVEVCSGIVYYPKDGSFLLIK